MSEKQATITIENVGPIEEFGYTLDSYGMHVLEGPHGCGKSTTLRTVELASGIPISDKLTKRRGAKKGSAVVAGKRISVTSQTRASGDFGLEELGDLDITVIHNGAGLADRKKRDARRVQAMLRAGQVKADIERFRDLDGFDDAVDVQDVPTTDLVAMAGFVKRQFEKQARAAEAKVAEAKEARIVAEDKFRGVDMTGETGIAKLSQDQADAIQRRADWNRANDEYVSAAGKADDAAEWLAANPKPEADIDAMASGIVAAKSELDEMKAELDRLKDRISKKQDDLFDLQNKRDNAMQYEQHAEPYRQSVSQFESMGSAPDTSELAQIEAEVSAASDAITNANVIIAAKEAKETADRHIRADKAYSTAADSYRKSAAKVATKLSESVAAIPGCPIETVFDDDGDVVLMSDGVPFDEKSDGERWRLVVPMCFAPDRIIVIPQAALGELSHETCDFLDQSAFDSQCFILTAKVTDSGVELHGHPWRDRTIDATSDAV